MTRIAECFKKAKDENRAALGIFITAGDPDAETCDRILMGLPDNGADFVELGMPFSDPMADGPSIQASSLRALKAGMTLSGVLDLAKDFRAAHPATPLVLMGYYNPIYSYGTEQFIADAVKAGVDGLIIVDLPPEEDDELAIPAITAGLDMIRLVTPTSDTARMEKITARAGGFIYYVSITGITGTRTANTDAVKSAVARIRDVSELPVAVGFGIKDAEAVAATGRHADAVVVGSAVVDTIASSLDSSGAPRDNTAHATLAMVAGLATGCRRGLT